MYQNIMYSIPGCILKGTLVEECVCVFKLSETAGPFEAKIHVAPPWDRGIDGKLIQMI